MVFGIPQGSVFGLTQFHLNVNDILHIFYKFKYVSFVEDTNSFYSCKTKYRKYFKYFNKYDL